MDDGSDLATHLSRLIDCEEPVIVLNVLQLLFEVSKKVWLDQAVLSFLGKRRVHGAISTSSFKIGVFIRFVVINDRVESLEEVER